MVDFSPKVTPTTRAAAREWTNTRFGGKIPTVNFDWRHRIIIAQLAEGCTYGEAAAAACIARQNVWKHMQASPAFAQAVGVSDDCLDG